MEEERHEKTQSVLMLPCRRPLKKRFVLELELVSRCEGVLGFWQEYQCTLADNIIRRVKRESKFWYSSGAVPPGGLFFF
jgi:hypothetical protein